MTLLGQLAACCGSHIGGLMINLPQRRRRARGVSSSKPRATSVQAPGSFNPARF